MAKSLRSKWKRKMKNIKRERYAKKELVRLKTMLGIKEEKPEVKPDVMMTDILEIATVTDAKSIKQKKMINVKDFPTVTTSDEETSEDDTPATNDPVNSEAMDHSQRRVYDKKTLKDQYGNFPIWMSGRKMKKKSKENKESKKKENKRLKKKRLRK